MIGRSPLNKLVQGRRYEVALKSDTSWIEQRDDYTGWIRDEGYILHQFGRGRARVLVDDRDIRYVIDRGPVSVKRDGRASWEHRDLGDVERALGTR